MSNNTSGSGFGQFVPGFEFLQSLVNPGAGNAGQGLGGMPNLGSWVAPTINVEDLEKRIEELKAVLFWLDQNSKALSATIQAMEVQKMTLATLRDLNVNFGDLAKAGKATMDAAAESMSARAAAATAAPAPEQAPPPPQEPETASAADKAGATQGGPNTIDAMQWWGALQQQFQTIAVNAMQDLASKSTPPKAKPAARSAAKKTTAARKTTATRKKAAPAARARTTRK